MSAEYGPYDDAPLLKKLGHHCNAYCGDGQHCGLIWTRLPPSEIVAGLADRTKMTVHHIQAATEAPPLSTYPYLYDHRRSRRVLHTKRYEGLPCYLVWFSVEERAT